MQYVTKEVSINHWITIGIKYLVSTNYFFTLRARQPAVLKLEYIIFDIALCYGK